MSRTAEQERKDIELMLNEIAADQAVNRYVIQCLLLNIVSAAGPGMIDGLKQQVLGSVARSLPQSDDREGDERRKQLTMKRAETLFLEIEEAQGRAETTIAPSDAN